ncbi:aspartate aminotransferase family protein [Actinoplanes sp. NBRC 103695]|uniref:pyridoxal phosphate-dependent decarboxylase family protein n=1 Tax=Actinoplanes sp. NBRC 103695 TaxID=3032202 RepID=UPI0024A08B2F|nr:aspartate aminotransferase family protein [Actinoplanes sp. NBRC 103695]GLY96551.1 pyridoxal-dependent decarboxylase [Actinoplanes sp. NBRC 103695]
MRPLRHPYAHLLANGTADAYRSTLGAGVDLVAARVAGTDRPFTGMDPQRLAVQVQDVDLRAPLGAAAAVLDELRDLYLRDAVWFHHPRYLAHLNCPVVIPALLGEVVLSAVNSSMDTWDQSAGATLIERRLIDWTAGRVGLGQHADGVFTSGGTQSNVQALFLAREQAGPGRKRILTSEAGHFSVQKAAKLLGLGADAVITVPTDARRRMSVDALKAALHSCADRGDAVMAVVATAGTTDFGTIDPLPAIADLCEAFGTWLHVDAAYGCGLLASPTRRHLLEGIERADSVTVDYHKSFFQPVSSSALLVRDGATLRHATFHADYLNPKRMAEASIPNQVDKSLQTTRRFDALKLWMTLRIMGADAIGELFDEVVDRATETYDLLAEDPRFEVVTRSDLSTVVFRYLPTGAGHPHADAANLHAREALAASGEAVIASTTIDGRHFLKVTLLNPLTARSDIEHVVELIATHAAELVNRRTAAVSA